MKMLPLDRLEPGMEVASDLRNFNQALLLVRGTILTPHHLRTLRMWGIASVPVTGEDEPAEAGRQAPLEFAPEILAEAEADVKLRWQHVAIDSPLTERVRALAVHRAALRRAGSPGAPGPAGP